MAMLIIPAHGNDKYPNYPLPVSLKVAIAAHKLMDKLAEERYQFETAHRYYPHPDFTSYVVLRYPGAQHVYHYDWATRLLKHTAKYSAR